MIFKQYFRSLAKQTTLLNRLFFLSLFLLQTACTDNNNTQMRYQLQGQTMGTLYHITVIADKNSFDASSIKIKLEQELQQINQQMSTYMPSSEISTFNQFNRSEWFPVSKPFAHVVDQSQKISHLTKGAFDITTASLVKLWGFGTGYQNKMPSLQEIDTVLQQTGYPLLTIRLNPPALKKLKLPLSIDLSAIAKGYAVDQLSKILINQGLNNHLVEIGGELKTRGMNKDKPWKIGINIPDKPAHNVYKKPLVLNNNEGVATSGDYNNYFEKSGKRYSHTINPATGKPVTHNLSSVTVVASSTLRADALATALMVMGEVKGKEFVQENKLKVLMLIKNADGDFSTWNTFESFD